MSSAAKLAAFAALLLAVFGGAALAGGAIGPEPERGDDGHAMGPAAGDGSATAPATGGHAEPEGGAHGSGGGAAAHGDTASDASAPAVKGLAVSDAGHTLELADARIDAGEPSDLRFRIVDRDGDPVTAFAVEHERRMHVIVVRRDGTGFQHLHPRMDADGRWRTRLRIDEPGAYRVFADFKKAGRAITLGADVAVDGPADYRAFPEPSAVSDTGSGYQVRIEHARPRAGEESELRFTVSRDGRPIHTEPYLGAGGHLVALREGDLAYLHTHPAADHGAGEEESGTHDDAVPFATTFPTAGRYRLYFQFKAAGDIHTAEFTTEVAR